MGGERVSNIHCTIVDLHGRKQSISYISSPSYVRTCIILFWENGCIMTEPDHMTLLSVYSGIDSTNG